MSKTDLQLGGGYTYQWECAILLALDYLLGAPLNYSSELHQLISEFLGQVEAVHLEGKTRDQEDTDLEDINLISADKRIQIQVKAKEAEGKWWVPSDLLLKKALYRFYHNAALDQDELSVRFVFLTNQTFNPALVQIKSMISENAIVESKQVAHLFNQVRKYAAKIHPETEPMDKVRFNRLLNHLLLVNFMSIDAVTANIQGKLKSLGIEAWQQAYEHLYTKFSKGSVRTGGRRINSSDLVDSLRDFSQDRFRLKVPPLALYQLPLDIDDFTGRQEEVSKLTELLGRASEAEGPAVVISALSGMAGVGKSALAVHVAHCLKDHFPGAQLYVDLRGAQGRPLDSFVVLGRLLRSLGVENQFIPESLDERSSLYRSQMIDKQALVLLDNACEEAQVRPLLPGNSSCAVLVTSRKRLSALEGGAFIDLKAMNEDEAVGLLRRLAGAERVQADSEAVRQIVTLCGRLPLALRIAGGKLRDKQHWDLETYASQLDNERRRLAGLQLGDLDVRASFALSYRDVTADDARLFRLLVLAGNSFSTEVAALLIEVNRGTAWEALERLVDLQLLEAVGDGYYRFHDLMYLFAQERLAKEETAESQHAARLRIECWYLTASDVHFYTQADILDRYVHSSNLVTDSIILETILAVLKTREDLRSYFFRSGPSVAWAPILHKHGFFKRPSPPKEQGQSYMLPSFDVFYYLNSVADQAAGVVVQVAESFEGANCYIPFIVRALKAIPAERCVSLLPRIIAWLDEPSIAAAIAGETAELVAHLMRGKQLDAALDLMQVLTAPISSSNVKTVGHMILGTEAQSKFPSMHDYEVELLFEHLIPKLAALAPEQVVKIFQEHLCVALRLEEAALGRPLFEVWSWRAAIEDTGQDLDNFYRDRLLRTLRDTLKMWVQSDVQATEPVIRDYLGHRIMILRRLGFYILGRFPTRHKKLAIGQLQKLENLEDFSIHHEFLTLLRTGFPLLDDLDQGRIVTAICDGPSPEKVREMANFAKENRNITDTEEYFQMYVQEWTRERLWMLQSHLCDKPTELLEKLNT